MTRSRRAHYLAAIVLLTGMFYTMMLWPPAPIPQKINMMLVCNQEPIESMAQQRTWKSWSHDYIDKVDFPVGWELTHYRLGSLGAKTNIFLDLRTIMSSQDGGEYEYTVITDYFSLSEIMISINGKPIGSHKGDLVESRFVAHLAPGDNLLEINYIQTVGLNSLKVFYRPLNSKRTYYVGQDSDRTHFAPAPFARAQQRMSAAIVYPSA
jgi:hypothetical protein